MLRAPQSRMDVLTQLEIDEIVETSDMVEKYNKDVDRESAYEILNEKIKEAKEDEQKAEMERQQELASKTSRRGRPRKEKSTFEQISENTMVRQIGRTVARELTRGLLGVLGMGGTTRKRRSTSRRRKSSRKRR